MEYVISSKKLKFLYIAILKNIHGPIPNLIKNAIKKTYCHITAI